MREVPPADHRPLRPEGAESRDRQDDRRLQHARRRPRLVHHDDHLRPRRPRAPHLLLLPVQGARRDGREGVRQCESERPLDGVRPQQAPPRRRLLLHHRLRDDEREQRRRRLLHDLQRGRHAPVDHPVHVARHHPGLHLHAARARHQAQDRQEGHVLPLPRRRHRGYGHDVHLRLHPGHQEQLRAAVHRPVRQVHRYHHRHGLHVGPRPGGHRLR